MEICLCVIYDCFAFQFSEQPHSKLLTVLDTAKIQIALTQSISEEVQTELVKMKVNNRLFVFISFCFLFYTFFESADFWRLIIVCFCVCLFSLSGKRCSHHYRQFRRRLGSTHFLSGKQLFFNSLSTLSLSLSLSFVMLFVFYLQSSSLSTASSAFCHCCNQLEQQLVVFNWFIYLLFKLLFLFSLQTHSSSSSSSVFLLIRHFL